MPTNPFGSGIRPWKRITETLRTASATVLGKGELVVTDGGRVYVPDGTSALKDLFPLLDATELPPQLSAVDNGDGTLSIYVTTTTAGAVLLTETGDTITTEAGDTLVAA